MTRNIKISLTGKQLLDNPALNKSTAFTPDERHSFQLTGYLPERTETLNEQVERTYQKYASLLRDLDKHYFLINLHDINQTLFYKLVFTHLNEMLPIIYTPTIAEAIINYSAHFQKPRGLIISYPHKDQMKTILKQHTNQPIELIIVTDGEGILGIGDQGVGGIRICQGKAMVYTLCANINPNHILNIQLDVGTNSETLFNDPLYLGWRHQRINGKEYTAFINQFVTTIHQTFPSALLHWEDFSKVNARNNLDNYRHKLCTFNDDIQGTGVVATACILTAIQKLKQKLSNQRIIVFGAGTSGVGIADQIVMIMQQQGLSAEEAYNKIYLVGRHGLLTTKLSAADFQKPYLKSLNHVEHWQIADKENISLLEVIKNAKPTILIGTSTVAGAFNEELVKTMASLTEYPIILPLSNPTAKSEAKPEDLIRWTDNKVFVATGSPFANVEYKGSSIPISQSNNAYAFPGIGLGAVACKANCITDNMLTAASLELSQLSLSTKEPSRLLPPLEEIQSISKQIAIAVAKQAIEDNIAEKVDIEQAVLSKLWYPEYYHYEKN